MNDEYLTTEVCPTCKKVTSSVRWVDIEVAGDVVPKRLSERCSNPECESNDANVTGFEVVKRATEGR